MWVRRPGMLTRNFYEFIKKKKENTKAAKDNECCNAASWQFGTYSEPWGLHDLYHRLDLGGPRSDGFFYGLSHGSGTSRFRSIWQMFHITAPRQLQQLPGPAMPCLSRTPMTPLTAPMTLIFSFTPRRRHSSVGSRCVLLSFKKRKGKAEIPYPENAPRAGWEKVGVQGRTSASSCPAGCHDFMTPARGWLRVLKTLQFPDFGF